MRSIPVFFLSIVLTLSVYRCYSSSERGNKFDSGLDQTNVFIYTGETGDSEPSKAGSSGVGGIAGGKGGIDIDNEDDEGTVGAPCTPNCPEMNWITIPGGTFMMGSAGGIGYDQEYPQHEVTVRSFNMSKTEVTVAQYGICVDAGFCGQPTAFNEYTAPLYNWGKSGRKNHPINGVNWSEARKYAQWLGGRLPSEAEWEYAARNNGQNIVYPWSNEEASCEYAVMHHDEIGINCENNMTAGVCSKPLGNTAQGLCDMAGNVFEWVEDDLHDSYSGAPSDGKAWIDNPRSVLRVLRGGSWYDDPVGCRSAARGRSSPGSRGVNIGFRVVLDIK